MPKLTERDLAVLKSLLIDRTVPLSDDEATKEFRQIYDRLTIPTSETYYLVQEDNPNYLKKPQVFGPFNNSKTHFNSIKSTIKNIEGAFVTRLECENNKLTVTEYCFIEGEDEDFEDKDFEDKDFEDKDFEDKDFEDEDFEDEDFEDEDFEDEDFEDEDFEDED